jgi:hypothetical protein
MRLPRMTTRRWMAAVGVIGLVMGGIAGGMRLRRRHDYFLFQAGYFSAMEIACQERKVIFVRHIEYPYYLLEGTERERSRLHKAIARQDQLIPYYAAMARKYRHATHHPWLPVQPDPPPP